MLMIRNHVPRDIVGVGSLSYFPPVREREKEREMDKMVHIKARGWT